MVSIVHIWIHYSECLVGGLDRKLQSSLNLHAEIILYYVTLNHVFCWIHITSAFYGVFMLLNFI